MTPAMAMSNMLVFVVTFFLARLVYGPYAIYRHAYYLYTVGRTAEESKVCLPRGFDHVITIVGMFFNILNAYWFYKILRKLQRKLKGTEGVKDSNEYTDDSNRKVKFKKEQD
jgi:TLC domain